MEWVWNYRVKLLLKEYLRGRVDDVEQELRFLETVWLAAPAPAKKDDA